MKAKLMMTDSTRHLTIREAEGQSFYVIGDIITIKVTGEETNGAYLIVEAVSQPGGGPYFLHTHTPQETFYVHDGVFEIYGQDENGEKYTIRAEAGDTVHVPGGVPHGFKNVSDKPARMTLTYHPAEDMLTFFQEIGIPMKDRNTLPETITPPDLDRIIALFKKNGELVEMPG